MKELMFIPTEDLIDELKSRCKPFIAAFINEDESGEKIQVRWGEADSWIELLGLVNAARVDIERHFVDATGKEETEE